MTKHAALPGTFADLKTVKTRSVVQMIVEFPIERGADVVAMFGFPQPGQEVPVAVARLNVAPQIEHAAPAGEKKRWGGLPPAQQAAIRCGEVAFQKFWSHGDLFEEVKEDMPNATAEERAAECVRRACSVKSRRDIADSPHALACWRGIEADYQIWLRAA